MRAASFSEADGGTVSDDPEICMAAVASTLAAVFGRQRATSRYEARVFWPSSRT